MQKYKKKHIWGLKLYRLRTKIEFGSFWSKIEVWIEEKMEKKAWFDLIWLKLKKIKSSRMNLKQTVKLEINWVFSWREKIKIES
jgi:hypothetical protein